MPADKNKKNSLKKELPFRAYPGTIQRTVNIAIPNTKFINLLLGTPELKKAPELKIISKTDIIGAEIQYAARKGSVSKYFAANKGVRLLIPGCTGDIRCIYILFI